jgi:hypothetical protein
MHFPSFKINPKSPGGKLATLGARHNFFISTHVSYLKNLAKVHLVSNAIILFAP